mmetsp:Transcript_86939/g.156601  ORF Transcript_86939/g.156601 Transcript_86939/m.156601 type:complete len:202 (+) Transcript_86939:52-657(+)
MQSQQCFIDVDQKDCTCTLLHFSRGGRADAATLGKELLVAVLRRVRVVALELTVALRARAAVALRKAVDPLIHGRLIVRRAAGGPQRTCRVVPVHLRERVGLPIDVEDRKVGKLVVHLEELVCARVEVGAADPQPVLFGSTSLQYVREPDQVVEAALNQVCLALEVREGHERVALDGLRHEHRHGEYAIRAQSLLRLREDW